MAVINLSLILKVGVLLLFSLSFGNSSCLLQNQTMHGLDHRVTHFTFEGEVLPILLEGSAVHRPMQDFLNHVVMIIGTEILGYAEIGITIPKLYSPTETAHALMRLSGCLDENCKTSRSRPSDAPSINLAMWMSNPVVLEGWNTAGTDGISQQGNHALYGRFGWYVSSDIVTSMWEGSSVVGDHWRSLQNSHYVSELSISGSVLRENTEDLLLYCNRPECTKGVFYPPWCSNETSIIGGSINPDCAYLLADYSELNFHMLSSQILELQLSVKVAWVGPNLPYVVKRLSDLHQPVLFFTLTPSDLLQYRSFTRISFPTCPTPELVEGDIQLGGCDFPWHPVTKIAWSVVEVNAPPLAAFIQNICIDDGDIEDIFSSYAHSKLDMEEFTCHWLQENHQIWLDWIPAGSLAVRRKVFLPGLFPTIDSADELYDISRGASMAVQALNKHTEILPQVELSLLPYSTQCETDQTLDVYSGIMQNYTKPLAGFLGPGCSSACENLSGVSKYFNQVIVSYFADSKSLAAKDRHPYLFRVFPDIQQIGFAKEQLFRYFEWTEFALISESDAPEMGDLSSVEDHLMISGIQCALCGTISHDNVEETITAIKNAKPEVVIAYTSEELAKKVTCEAFKQGLILDNGFMWIFPSWYNEDWWDLDKQNLTGAIGCSTSDMKTALSGGITLTRVNLAEPDQVIAGGSTMSSWFDDFYELGGSNKSFVPLAAYAYDAVFTFAFALEKLFNEDATHLDSLQSDKTTDLFVEYLRNTSFVGATGPVDFINQDRRSPVTIMVNFFDSDPYQVVLGQYIPTPGTLDGGELYIDKSVADRMKRDYDFLTGETEVKTCAVERVREMLGSSCATAVVALCLLFTLILLVMTLSLGFLFKKKYDKKVKKAELRMKKLGILNLGIDSLSTLDKWEMARENVILNRKLGEGAFGTVYGGEAFLEGQSWAAVAVKTLKMGSSIEEKLDFLSEAEMMKRFDHKNIIRLRGVCTHGEPLYAVMDFMLYGDLKTFLLARRHLVGQHSDEAEVLLPHRLTAMVHDIASGLDYLAKCKYVHRDLACRNCLVNSCYSVMISDFGMTRALYDSNYYRLNKQGRLPVRWMAPESVSEGLFTTMSDIWSLGVVIYEVVTFGGFPYPEMSNAAVLEYIREGNSMSPPENCPQMLSSLMLQCWVTEAYVRPTAEDIMNLLAENQEMIEPCISVPHESMSVDGLSSGNFSPGLSSRHSFRSWDVDFSSESSSVRVKSSIGSLRKVLQSSLTKKRAKRNGTDEKVSPGLVRRGDLEFGLDVFTRQERERSSDRSQVSQYSGHMSKVNPVMSNSVRPYGRNDSTMLETSSSFDDLHHLPTKSLTKDESFESLSKRTQALRNEYPGQRIHPHHNIHQHTERKQRSDSAPLIPKSKRNSLGKLRSKSIGNSNSMKRTSNAPKKETEPSDRIATVSETLPCYASDDSIQVTCL